MNNDSNNDKNDLHSTSATERLDDNGQLTTGVRHDSGDGSPRCRSREGAPVPRGRHPQKSTVITDCRFQEAYCQVEHHSGPFCPELRSGHAVRRLVG